MPKTVPKKAAILLRIHVDDKTLIDRAAKRQRRAVQPWCRDALVAAATRDLGERGQVRFDEAPAAVDDDSKTAKFIIVFNDGEKMLVDRAAAKHAADYGIAVGSMAAWCRVKLIAAAREALK